MEYLNIHRRLFQDIYKHAGKIRDYNITKQEWVLNGETVLFASAGNLKATLEYDFEQEKKFSYKGLSQQETIEHIAHFISYLWQAHILGEGNTRTTAIFLIKYLRTFGFKVNNTLFEQHSWYFRKGLVRANYKNQLTGIHDTNEFFASFFGNLLLGENHTLKNREMHVLYLTPESTTEKTVEKSSEKITRLIKDNVQITIKELAERVSISTRAIEKNIAKLKSEDVLERIGGDKGGHWKVNEK